MPGVGRPPSMPDDDTQEVATEEVETQEVMWEVEGSVVLGRPLETVVTVVVSLETRRMGPVRIFSRSISAFAAMIHLVVGFRMGCLFVPCSGEGDPQEPRLAELDTLELLSDL